MIGVQSTRAKLGSTRKARTSDHIFILKTLIDKYCKAGKGKLYTCFVDFRKAFDSVLHSGLKLKLLRTEISSKFYSLISDMYSKSYSYIKIGKNLTSRFQNNLGVRQGDNLSANLFKIYLNDLPKIPF